VFLWEGHHATLVKEWGFCEWAEAVPPFVFLQSCLALMEEKVQPLLDRGAVAVVGTSTRTYSASGGAFSLAYFNAILYEQRTLGEALRQAKNFMQAYIQLKEKRLGADARRTGANHRAAWAFTLWGDPTLKLPPAVKSPQRQPVRHEVVDGTLRVKLPDEKHERIRSEVYRADLSSNARMAGLVRGQRGDSVRPLVPLVFAEVPLLKGPEGRVPRLTSRLPEDHYVFNWDARRRCGYLLALPRARDRDELRFQVRWVAPAELAAGR
jgi:hypothetical protein